MKWYMIPLGFVYGGGYGAVVLADSQEEATELAESFEKTLKSNDEMYKAQDIYTEGEMQLFCDGRLMLVSYWE